VRVASLLLVCLAALALLAAWQLPGRLDWNRYRDTIEAVASSTLGRPVTIAGKITLSLLPETELTAAGVVIGAPESNAPGPTMQVQALRLRVALLPLLAGRVEARELALHGANLTIPWPLARGDLAGWPPEWLAAFSARVEDGQLRLGSVALTGVDATLATSDSGALTASGTAQLSGQPIHFTARLTAAGGDGAAGLDVALDGQGRLAGSGAGFAGQMAADGTMAGRLVAHGRDLSLLTAAPSVPFQAEAALKISGSRIGFDDLALDVGGTALGGSVELRLLASPRLDARLSAARFDLDAWQPVLFRLGRTGMPVGLDLSAEAAGLDGGVVHDLHVVLDLSEGQIALRDLTALLPGEATLGLSGQVQRTDPARPRFDGDARLAAPALRTTLNWLDGAGINLFPGLPADVLNSVTLSAHVAAEPGLLALSRIDAKVDGAKVGGELRLWPSFKAQDAKTPDAKTPASTKAAVPKPGAAKPSEGHPAIVATLTVDRLALDPWLSGRWPTMADLTGLLNGRDVDLRLHADAASLAGQDISGLSLDAASQSGQGDGQLVLRRLEATLSGVHLVASGTMGGSGRVNDGRLDARTDDATPLADLLPPSWSPTEAFWRGPAILSAQLAGPPEALGLQLRLEMADARLEAQPVFDLKNGRWAGPVTLRHPGAPQFLAALGLPGTEPWLGEGSLSVIAQLSATPGRLAADQLDLIAGPTRFSASLNLDTSQAVPRLGGRINADVLTLPRLLPTDQTPLPFAWLHGWQGSLAVTARQVLIGLEPTATQAAGVVSLSDTGALRIDPFTARLGDGPLSMTLALNSAAEPPTLALNATLSGAAIDGALTGLPLDLLSGRADAALNLAATGHSPAAMLATLSGTASAHVGDGALTGFDLFRARLAARRAERNTAPAAEAALRDALAGGSTGFDRLDLAAAVSNGVLSLHDSGLQGSTGTVDLAGSIGLGAGTLDLHADLHPALTDPPEIGLRLTGSLGAPERAPELAGFLRWVGAHPP
jgi:uncharacterized protein involved in outer membrane biogenesis